MNIENWKLKNPKYILDWDEVEKGMMIGYISLLITAWDILALNIIHFFGKHFQISPKHSIADFGYQYSMASGLTFSFICILSLIIGANIRQASKAIKHYYMYMGMFVYVIGNILVIHMFGEFSMPSGVIIAGAPIVGWVLFETRGVILATIAGVIGVLFAFSLSYMQLTPYAPLVAPDYAIHKNLAYLISLIVVIAPHLISLLFLAHRSIKHWKDREESANYLAGIDSLTNIPNRRQIIQILQTTISESIQKNTTTSVAMFDLDNFKTINDRYGHHVGDQVLNECVEIVQNKLRTQDQIGRLGGDEFFLILPNSSQDTAFQVTQRCLNKLRTTNIIIDNVKHRVTASFGVLALPKVIDNNNAISKLIEESFINVDKALYAAKENGRNQVIAA